MPFHLLMKIIAVVFMLAAVTVSGALAFTDVLQVTPTIGLAGLTLIALCASFGWRVYADRKSKNGDEDA
ncbi:MAG: hypothetical protein ACJAZ1_000784 [Yoonia sp.]|jgi:membrane protein implicated in regulation of membrane protease activity